MKVENTKDWVVYRRLFRRVLVHKVYLICSILGYILFSATQVALADLIQIIVDFIGGNTLISTGLISKMIVPIADEIEMYWLIPIILFILMVLRGISYFIANGCMSIVANSVVHSFRIDLFDNIIRLKSFDISHIHSGSWIAKLVSHTGRVFDTCSTALRVVVRDGAFIILLLGYLFYLNFKITILFILIVPLIFIIVWITNRRFRKLNKRIQESIESLSEYASEIIRNVTEVKMLNLEDSVLQSYIKKSDKQKRQDILLSIISAFVVPLIQIMIGLVLAILIWIILQPSIIDTMSPGQFVSYLVAAGLLAKPSRQLSNVHPLIQTGIVAARDIFYWLDKEKESGDHYPIQYESTEELRGDIVFEQVGFSYHQSDIYIFKHLSFTIPYGGITAIIGKSGVGKTTIIKLLCRQHEEYQGEILINGRNIQDVPIMSLRHQISWVNQTPMIFKDTIYNNIICSNPEASFDDVKEVAEKAAALEFILSLPDQWDTVVGEDGNSLSGGQKQRIAIARSLLKKSPIIIFDEATSALDPVSEKAIRKALVSISQDHTCIVIAHKESTIQDAKHIILLGQGSLLFSGPKEDFNHSDFFKSLEF